VLVGMVYAFILFMLLPLYNALETLDRDQLEAARDLGAGTLRIHRRIVIPHAKPGIAVGCIMVFMLAVSSYAVPVILGSPGTRWFTEIIYQWFFEGQNWPQGSAYAFILLVLCLGFILLMMRLFRVGLADIAR
jgi:spermidine/putrescine transport system permease protein